MAQHFLTHHTKHLTAQQLLINMLQQTSDGRMVQLLLTCDQGYLTDQPLLTCDQKHLVAERLFTCVHKYMVSTC